MLAAGQVDAAFELASSTSQSYPKCGECAYLEARSARRQGDFKIAGSALEKAAELKWNPEDIHREQVLAVVQRGGVASVKRHLQDVFETELEPAETEEVYEAMAYGHLAAYDIPEFLKCVDFWLDWNPKATKPRLMRAAYFARIGNHSEAAGFYASLATDHPDCREARLGWGECLLELNDPDAAAAQLEMCLAQQRDARTAVLLAQALVQTGQGERAGDLLREFQDEPNRETRGEVLEQLGRWHLDRGEAEDAVRILSQAVETTPESASAWHVLAAAHTMLGHTDEAQKALEVSQKTKDRVLRLAAIAIELSTHPDDSSLRLEAAEILFAQKMDQDAIAWINTVLNRNVHHREANEMLARYYRDQGDDELAEKHERLGGIK
ncbi:MAG: tetratricopeptide repeat protein [Planctomycetaceae bacterium]